MRAKQLKKHEYWLKFIVKELNNIKGIFQKKVALCKQRIQASYMFDKTKHSL